MSQELDDKDMDEPVARGSTTWGECPACRLRRVVPGAAWYRKRRPICEQCGTDLKRRCQRCNCFLRGGNQNILCSPCRCRNQPETYFER
jgi:uncharacterized protein (DUF983 family)